MNMTENYIEPSNKSPKNQIKIASTDPEIKRLSTADL
jgi:hypothetical protein